MSSSTSPSEEESQRPVYAIPFPNIWRRLTIRNNNTGERYNIRIEDITSDRHDEVWDMFREHYYTDEPITRSINMSAEKDSMLIAKQLDYEKLSQNLSIIAVLDNEDPKPTILGGLLLTTFSKYDSPDEPTKPKAKAYCCYKLNRLMEWLRTDDDIFELLETDYLLEGCGLVVKREYRGMGIGLELFRTVECIAKAFDYPAVITNFIHPGSKKIGVSLGVTVLNEGRLVDCVDERGQKVFPDADPEIIILTGYIKYGT